MCFHRWTMAWKTCVNNVDNNNSNNNADNEDNADNADNGKIDHSKQITTAEKKLNF